jgi:hypothetical protein
MPRVRQEAAEFPRVGGNACACRKTQIETINGYSHLSDNLCILFVIMDHSPIRE